MNWRDIAVTAASTLDDLQAALAQGDVERAAQYAAIIHALTYWREVNGPVRHPSIPDYDFDDMVQDREEIWAGDNRTVRRLGRDVDRD